MDQSRTVRDWQSQTRSAGLAPKPVMQPLYVDLAEDPTAPPQPIHLGYRLGTDHLRAELKALEQIGINHVALNLRFNRASIEDTLERLSNEVLPDFQD